MDTSFILRTLYGERQSSDLVSEFLTKLSEKPPRKRSRQRRKEADIVRVPTQVEVAREAELSDSDDEHPYIPEEPSGPLVFQTHISLPLEENVEASITESDFPDPDEQTKQNGFLRRASQIEKRIELQRQAHLKTQRLETSYVMNNDQNNPLMQSRLIKQQLREAEDDDFYLNGFILQSKFGIVDKRPPIYFDIEDPSFIPADLKRPLQKDGTPQWNEMNFERKRFYSKLTSDKTGRREDHIVHSKPAVELYLVDFSSKDMDRWHHPRIDGSVVVGQTLPVTYRPPKENNTVYLNDIESLSAKRNTVIVIEHKSEEISLIMNVGMGSIITQYYRKRGLLDPVRLDRLVTVLETHQNWPLITKIPCGHVITVLTCNLFDIPIAQHQVEPTDFLLVRPPNERKFYIRKINAIYCAGLQETKTIVHKPFTNKVQAQRDMVMKACAINVFRGTPQYRGRTRVVVPEFQKAYFPMMSINQLRKVTRSFARLTREYGKVIWELAPDIDLDAEFSKTQVTPEDVCRFQATNAGLYKLRQRGVNELIRSRRVYAMIPRLRGVYTRAIAATMEKILMRTPWTRTVLFNRARTGHSVKISQTDSNEPPTANQLRLLYMDELRHRLHTFGVPLEKIDQLGRWDRVRLLRDLYKEAYDKGNFIPYRRSEFTAALGEYQKAYTEVFLDNLFSIECHDGNSGDTFHDDSDIDYLSRKIIENSIEEEDELDDADIEDDSKSEVRFEKTDDIPQLYPHSPFCSKTVIDWDYLGFSNYERRPVAKLITVSPAENGPPTVSIQWLRQPHQLKVLSHFENPVNSSPSPHNRAKFDFMGHVLDERKKAVLERLAKAKAVTRNKGADTPTQNYLPFDPSCFIVRDDDDGLTIQITKKTLASIEEASRQYNEFVSTMAAPQKRVKTLHVSMNPYDIARSQSAEIHDDDLVMDKRKKKKRKGPVNPLSAFNEVIKGIINRMISRSDGKFALFKEPILRKYNPDYHKVISNPMCFEDILRKCKYKRYTRVDELYYDAHLISDNCIVYNREKDESLVTLAEQMFSAFNSEVRSVRKRLDKLESQIDPLLRNDDSGATSDAPLSRSMSRGDIRA